MIKAIPLVIGCGSRTPGGEEWMNALGTKRKSVALALFRVAMAVALCLTFSVGARADGGLPQPSGPVVLVITGDIARSNGPNRASFDIDMLKQIGMTSLVTSTPWTEGTSKFEGVLARDVLHYVGARSDHITAISMNDYLVEIPVKDFIDHDVIFALKRDGKFLGVRDMGPVLIVYPFDRDTSLWTESVFTRCVLQLGAVYVGTPGTVPLASLLPGEQTPIYSTVPTHDMAGGSGDGTGTGAPTNNSGADTNNNQSSGSGTGTGSGPNGSLNGGSGTGLGVGGLGGTTPSGGKNPTGDSPSGGKPSGDGSQSAVHSGGGSVTAQ
jgi:hypothetical protein